MKGNKYKFRNWRCSVHFLTFQREYPICRKGKQVSAMKLCSMKTWRSPPRQFRWRCFFNIFNLVARFYRVVVVINFSEWYSTSALMIVPLPANYVTQQTKIDLPFLAYFIQVRNQIVRMWSQTFYWHANLSPTSEVLHTAMAVGAREYR